MGCCQSRSDQESSPLSGGGERLGGTSVGGGGGGNGSQHRTDREILAEAAEKRIKEQQNRGCKGVVKLPKSQDDMGDTNLNDAPLKCHATTGQSFWRLGYFAVAIAWCGFVLFEVYIFQKVHQIFRTTGASLEKARAEFSSGAGAAHNAISGAFTGGGTNGTSDNMFKKT